MEKDLENLMVVWELTRRLIGYADHDGFCKWWENGDCDCGYEQVKLDFDAATELLD